MTRHLVIASAVVCLYCYAGSVSAAAIILSDFSSDSTAASVLDATLDVAISDTNEVTLSVTNETTAPDEYDINFVYFNATSNVTGLTLDGVTSSIDGDITGSWNLNTSKGADGFGTFDFELATGAGNNSNKVKPGEIVDYVLTILGTGPFSALDFTSQLSTIPPGNIPAIAAAKFVSGPDDDSAFGATTPEPATAALLVIGGLAILGRGVRTGT